MSISTQTELERLTVSLDRLFESPQPGDHDDDVDEAQIGQDGNKVQVKLLIGLEILDINAGWRSAAEYQMV